MKRLQSKGGCIKDDPGGTGLGGKWGGGVQDGGDTCIPMQIHTDVWQKPSQYCEAIICQLK